MRSAVKDAVSDERDLGVMHVGLGYGALAPIGADGKVPDNWLKRLAGCRVPEDYAHAFARWKRAFEGSAVLLREVSATSRVLVGAGLSSAIDAGLAIHHTWGTPILPGSALKGLLSHYVDTVYGPDHDGGRHPDDPAHPDPARARFRGVSWNGTRIQHGPGAIHRRLFGAPDADSDHADPKARGARRGELRFHDGWMVPGSIEKPFAVDVLTVHQRRYYSGHAPASDHDAPNPVQFLSVHPGTVFLLAIEGEPGLAGLALELLVEALREWGIGAKTSSGMGRFAAKGRVQVERADDAMREFDAWMADQQSAIVAIATPEAGVEWMRATIQRWRDRLTSGAWQADRFVQCLETAKARMQGIGKKQRAKVQAVIDDIKRPAP